MSTVAPVAPGHFEAELHPQWTIGGKPNGGYLLAIAARALAAALARPDPVTISAHYFHPGKPGDVTIETQVLKEGRRFGSGTATLLSNGRALLGCIGTFGDLTEASGPEILDQGPPEMPDPGDCLPVVATDTFPPPFMGKIELRLHPEDGQFLLGKRTGHALMRGWFRLRDEEPADTIALLCAADAFPPTAFNADFPVAWIKQYGNGRVFSSTFGHSDQAWDDPRVQTLYLEAAKWVLKLTDYPVRPHPMASP